MNLIQTLTRQNIITPPKWLPENVHYLTMMGSHAYGCENADSDRDVYGWCVPPRGLVFPHEEGYILGFGRQIPVFENWQQHKVESGYDLTVYSVVRYFHLCMENNPNMLDSLFTPHSAVMCNTAISQRVRMKRKVFLHAGYFHKAKGFAYSQLHKMDATQRENPKRQESIDKYGYDVKFGYHVVRLMLQCEQVLTEGDMDLTRHNETYKAIRRGDWPKEKVVEFFNQKERLMEELYTKPAVPHKPDEQTIKQLLLEVLETHYGALPIRVQTDAEVLVDLIKQTIAEAGY